MASEQSFAVWITGLPASGKSTIARCLKAQLAARGIDAAILESDELRRVLTLNPTYDSTERDQFYRSMIFIGTLLVKHGVPVIFDATAHRRAWREQARSTIARFLEIYVDCPLEICMGRDPKGIYKQARGRAGTVPGVHEAYEQPENPDVVIHCDHDDPQDAAVRILLKLIGAGFVECQRD